MRLYDRMIDVTSSYVMIQNTLHLTQNYLDN